MLTQLATRPGLPRPDNPYLPHPARVTSIQPLTPDTRLFQLRFVDERFAHGWSHGPGQFVELSVIGTGEAPISIASSPTRRGVLELCVRRVGRLTSALFRLEPGALVGVRGPYGNGFPIAAMEGQDLLIIAGGLGMAPLRSLLWYAVDRRDHFRHVALLYGARTPADMLFRSELEGLAAWGSIATRLTVDRDPDGRWTHQVGLLPPLLRQIDIEPSRTYAAVVGPPVLYKLVLAELLALRLSKDRILMSLERRMKCGVGKCGHCTVGYKYTCIDGPVFTYWDAINLPEIV